MSLAVLMGRGIPVWWASPAPMPSVAPENVTILGAREVDPGRRRWSELGVRVITMSEIDERGIAACMDEALERANRGTAGLPPLLRPGRPRPP